MLTGACEIARKKGFSLSDEQQQKAHSVVWILPKMSGPLLCHCQTYSLLLSLLLPTASEGSAVTGFKLAHVGKCTGGEGVERVLQTSRAYNLNPRCSN